MNYIELYNKISEIIKTFLESDSKKKLDYISALQQIQKLLIALDLISNH